MIALYSIILFSMQARS